MKSANVTGTKSKKLTGVTKTPGGRVGGGNKAVQAIKSPKGKVGCISKAPKTASPSK